MKFFILLLAVPFIASAQTLEERVRVLEAKVRKIEQSSPEARNPRPYCYCSPLGGDSFRPIFVDIRGGEIDMRLGTASGEWCMAVIKQNPACNQ